jgi:hypothetical protein
MRGQADGLAAQVPQRAVDRADRQDRRALAPMNGMPVQEIPQTLTRDRVGALQQPGSQRSSVSMM